MVFVNDLGGHKPRLRWAGMFVLGLFFGGLVFDNFAGVNKIGATPTWSLWCAALTCAVWMIVYRVRDVGGYDKWAILARPAGANPLIAYLLHPILISLISLSGLWNQLVGHKNSSTAVVVVCGSLVMALVVAALTGAIARIGLRVRI